MYQENPPVGCMVVILLISLLLTIGWVINIVKFAQCDFDKPYKAEVIRGVGIVMVPVGGVVGYLSIDDTPKLKPKPSPETIE